MKEDKAAREGGDCLIHPLHTSNWLLPPAVPSFECSMIVFVLMASIVVGGPPSFIHKSVGFIVFT